MCFFLSLLKDGKESPEPGVVFDHYRARREAEEALDNYYKWRNALKKEAAMSEELLPCPFCGGEAEIHEEHIYMEGRVYRTRCSVCYVQTDYYAGPTAPELISDWNRRVWVSPETHEAATESLAWHRYELGLAEERLGQATVRAIENAKLRKLNAEIVSEAEAVASQIWRLCHALTDHLTGDREMSVSDVLAYTDDRKFVGHLRALGAMLNKDVERYHKGDGHE